MRTILRQNSAISTLNTYASCFTFYVQCGNTQYARAIARALHHTGVSSDLNISYHRSSANFVKISQNRIDLEHYSLRNRKIFLGEISFVVYCNNPIHYMKGISVVMVIAKMQDTDTGMALLLKVSSLLSSVPAFTLTLEDFLLLLLFVSMTLLVV